MTVKAGDTFLMPLGVSGRREHLWFALTEQDAAGKFLGVNLTSYEVFKDQTVILTDGHPFITKKSVVEYPDARIFETEQIDTLVTHGMAQRMAPCSQELLDRLRQGLLDSDNTPQEAQQYLKDHT